MRVRVHVGHRVAGERDVVAKLLREAGCGFDAGAGRDTADNDLRHAILLEPGIEIGVCEGAPSAFGNDMIGSLLPEFGDEFEEFRRKARRHARLLVAAGRHARNVYQHYRPIVFAERVKQSDGILHYAGNRVGAHARKNALLQIDDDQCGSGIECRNGHEVSSYCSTMRSSNLTARLSSSRSSCEKFF